jgi:hypothetical protein
MKKILPMALFAITTVSQAQTPNFKEQQIDGEVGIGYGLAVADVNGDRQTDILLADSNVIVWYENPTWKKHVIAEKLTEKDHVCIAARDIDGDGKCEIAVGAEWNPGDTTGSGAVFYLIPPADRTQKWEPVKLTHEPTTHRMKWVRNRAGRYDLVVVPLHGRGNDKNAEGAGVRVLAYHMPDDPAKSGTPRSCRARCTRRTTSTSSRPGHRGGSLLLCGREGVVRLDQTDNGWKEQWIAQHPKDQPRTARRGRSALRSLCRRPALCDDHRAHAWQPARALHTAAGWPEKRHHGSAACSRATLVRTVTPSPRMTCSAEQPPDRRRLACAA